MDNDYLVLSTAVSPIIKRQILYKGTVLASCGVLLLLLSGIFLPVSVLKHWGVFILFFGGLLITWGLLPYRKIIQLDLNKNQLIIETDQVVYVANKKRTVGIPKENIEKIAFLEKGSNYGIAVWLKWPLPAKFTLFDKEFNIASFQQQSRDKWNCDLFFPYFTQKSYSDWINQP